MGEQSKYKCEKGYDNTILPTAYCSSLTWSWLKAPTAY